MLIGVLSDSHGRLQPAREAIRLMGSVEAILHAGDYLEDARTLALETGLPFYAVAGNCDFYRGEEGPLEQILNLAGKRIWLTHGHQAKVKNGYQILIKEARQKGVDLVIFGHTHIPDVFHEEGIIFFNPGSIASPRDRQELTFGLIEIGEEGIWAQHRELPQGKVHQP